MLMQVEQSMATGHFYMVLAAGLEGGDKSRLRVCSRTRRRPPKQLESVHNFCESNDDGWLIRDVVR